VLLLSGLQSPESVASLVAGWNPAVVRRGSDNGSGSSETRTEAGMVADAVRWHGPIRLTPMLRADAGLASAGESHSGGIAYVAEVRRHRAKIADSRQIALVRQRYPHGLPAGAEADAWRLVRGLAKRLRGSARLPGSPLYTPHLEPTPLPGDDDFHVYSHEMLPWIVLREILRPLAPELSREALPNGGGYVLRQRDVLEVSVRPADARSDLPYAIRDRADEAWPHSVYDFRRVAGSTHNTAAVTNAASLIAEITGGVLLDADGFAVPLRSPGIAPRQSAR
jgi:hypothetical protein